ncbi:MAG TPA: multidrug ABC transporter ATP-binding protein, partial [Burkholderiaceae bacterium]
MPFRRFEKLLDPYPAAPPTQPPRGFFAFVWACTEGGRGAIVWMTLFTAGIGAFEALLFSMLGHIVDWLAHVEPARLWTDERGNLLLLAGILIASPLLIALQNLVKHQTLAGNLPMRLRWNFHRWMLGQSMSFYQDEFAGRIAAKVMQTALAAREVVLILCDIL